MVNDAWQECLKPEDVPTLLDGLRTRGEAALTGCHHVIEKSRVGTHAEPRGKP